MALPRRRQRLAKLIPFHDLTRRGLAARLDITEGEVNNLCKGLRYPSPGEITKLESIFNLSIEQIFEPAMLVHRSAESWPPHGKGFRPARRS